VIPPFHEAVDNAVQQLAPDGFMGATDFFVSGKYDTPMRQMAWGRRFFWRCARTPRLATRRALRAACCARARRAAAEGHARCPRASPPDR
jgi:hypothetical protein